MMHKRIVAKLGAEEMYEAMGIGTQATMDLRLPLVGFYAVAACGAVAAALLALRRVWDLWQRAESVAPPAADA